MSNIIYTVTTHAIGPVYITGSDGVTSVITGTSQVSLTDAQYTAAVLKFGTNNVVPAPTANNAVGPANFATSQAAITTTSVAALAARTGAVGTGRVSVTIYNLGSATAYLGTSTGVTPSTGLPILPGGSYTKCTTAALYAVTSLGSTTLAFDEDY